MRKWPVTVVLALGLLAGVATASSALSGTYRVTITGKPAPLNGKWQLKFLPGDELRVVRNGRVVVVAKAIVNGSRVKVIDRSGSYACSVADGAGVYTYKVAGTRLTFKAVVDKCVGRKLILTTKPFVKFT